MLLFYANICNAPIRHDADEGVDVSYILFQ